MSLIGQTIKWHRMRQGITQEQLAEGICSSAYLSKLENNQISLNKEIVSQLCERMELPVEKFISSSDEQVKKMLEDWIEALHSYDLNKAESLYREIQLQDEKNIAVELSYLYELTLFAHYVYTGQHEKLDEKFTYLQSFSWILEEHYPYSYHKFVGYYYLTKFYCANAIKHFKLAEKLIKETSDPNLYLMIASAYTRMEMILRSNKYALKAFQTFQANLDYTRVISCQIILGLNYCLIADLETAESYFGKLRNLDEAQVGGLIKSVIYMCDGIMSIQKHEYEAAREYFEKVISRQTNHEVELISSHYLAMTYFYLGENNRAIQELNRGLEIARSYHNTRYQHKLKSILYYFREQHEELHQLLIKEAIPFYQKLEEDHELCGYYLLAGSVMNEMKRYKDATKYLMAAYRVNRSEDSFLPNPKSAKVKPGLPLLTY
uniref:helix-turn-helix domain-containing protein n=1 Tax=uncultured Allobacillus sp. TaxID=1638025 RepID=UPI0025925023|nr:helix-turn-helix domain-containing protein [uncultured Allobacillus sp.]